MTSSFSQNSTRVEIIITISTAIRIKKITKTLFHTFMQFSTLIVIIILARAALLRKSHHFLKFSSKTWNKEN